MIQEITHIQKENITAEKFIRHEVLPTTEERAYRHRQLEKATLLGNVHHYKVKIRFETERGTKQVETTIWESSEASISLKGGVMIPAHCIWEIVI